jgi:hypothetical protein
MRPNPLVSWELRIGKLRVYYDIEEESEKWFTSSPSESKSGIAYGSAERKSI